ncbi:hypothetical protein P152DRAFT_446114 [Eremomyces bilateralis CBS 781.70]|uniref:Polyprenal reductase n=1 Tax=Eremomyces bilateralis CBS 781.70 TaxID=1392243 RepID=A0A6G1GEL9_9PEZI|nr:uncharacterized protein P152DRAFT_446114 [Eremomyces bilateralis CBS 781.70]KAF1816462.1 hypothetical protein P152DRAFT_446114 [Eremomyces bilateralis CBS 781.70]
MMEELHQYIDPFIGILKRTLESIDIPSAIQAYYIYTSLAILIAANIPALQTRFFDYGARASSHNPTHHASRNPITHLLDLLATFSVPHAYFTHFYLLSTLSSLLWLFQFLHPTAPLLFIQSHSSPSLSYPLPPVPLLGSLLLLLQGLRRLAECLTWPASRTSRMWFAHWVVGLLFYATMGVAVWVRELDALAQGFPQTYLNNLLRGELDVRALRATAVAHPTRVVVPLIVFLGASVAQHLAHRHLAGLRRSSLSVGVTESSYPEPASVPKSASHSSPPRPTYRLPTHPLFTHTLTPHYLSEVLIYLCLARITARDGEVVNPVVMAGAGFVAVNLGVTAGRTGRWYRERFGERVKGRARMVPGVW